MTNMKEFLTDYYRTHDAKGNLTRQAQEGTMFERWANEGGIRVRFEMLSNGDMQIVIFSGDYVKSSAHLASFRVDHLKRWLNGEKVQPY